MPKKLKKFEHSAGVAGSEYDWPTLLDGAPYHMIEGEDFTCKPQTLRMMAYKQGDKKDLAVQVTSVPNEQYKDMTKGLVIQATPMTDEQKATRDQRRKEAADKKAAEEKEEGAAE